jgi:uncharacterized Zn finger protein
MIKRVRCECGATLYFLEVDAEGKKDSVLRCCNCHNAIPVSVNPPSLIQTMNSVNRPEEPLKQLTGTVKAP